MVLQHTEALTRSLKTEYDAVFYSLQYRAVSEYQLPQTFFLKFLYPWQGHFPDNGCLYTGYQTDQRLPVSCRSLRFLHAVP